MAFNVIVVPAFRFVKSSASRSPAHVLLSPGVRNCGQTAEVLILIMSVINAGERFADGELGEAKTDGL